MPEVNLLQTPSLDTLTSWLIGWVVKEFKNDRESITPDQAFLSFGMDSVQAMTMVGDLESDLNLRLSPTLVWDYPTIGELAEHLAERLGVAISPLEMTSVPAPGPSDHATSAVREGLSGELDSLDDPDRRGLLNPLELSQ